MFFPHIAIQSFQIKGELPEILWFETIHLEFDGDQAVESRGERTGDRVQSPDLLPATQLPWSHHLIILGQSSGVTFLSSRYAS